MQTPVHLRYYMIRAELTARHSEMVQTGLSNEVTEAMT